MPELREDLIASAVAFLQDPQVLGQPREKQIEFLKTKDLNDDEITEAINRSNKTAEDASKDSSEDAESNTTSTQQQRQIGGSSSQPPPPPPIPPYSYAAYTQPPPLPERDWKDYFVMATTSVGVTYAIYQIAKRYVLPKILPPSAEELDASTASIEEQFKEAQTVLDTLIEENAELKRKEVERTKKIEEMVAELESTLQLVELQATRGDQDMEIVTKQIEAVKESIPKDLKIQSDAQAKELNDILNDLKSLKQLVTTTRSQTPPPPPTQKFTNPPQLPTGTPSVPTPSTNPPQILSVSNSSPSSSTSSLPAQSMEPSPAANTAPISTTTPRIPAWQLAASESTK